LTSRDEHVPDIERHIGTLKERARVTSATLIFKSLPPWMVIEMIYGIIFWRNAFPLPSGISKTICFTNLSLEGIFITRKIVI